MSLRSLWKRLTQLVGTSQAGAALPALEDHDGRALRAALEAAQHEALQLRRDLTAQRQRLLELELLEELRRLGPPSRPAAPSPPSHARASAPRRPPSAPRTTQLLARRWVTPERLLRSGQRLSVSGMPPPLPDDFAPDECGLVVVRGPRVGTVYRLGELPLVLGREGADVDFPDDSVSRRHAKLERVGGQPFVIDLGSTNGTFHNGARLSERQRLFDGDRLALARVELMFHTDSELRARQRRR